MACGCSSSPSTYTSNVVSNGCGVPSCNCNLPRRSSIPPVVPVLWKDAARFRQMAAGVLVVHCGEEMGSLDSPVDGIVAFDSATQKVYVTTNSVEWIRDLFPCTENAIYGFPVYGVKPECRDLGENPDRRLAIVRPPNSAFGVIYAHHTTCSPILGLKPEITPVQLVPDPFPEVAPTRLYSVAWIDVPAGEDCSVATRHYYATPAEHISSIDSDRMRPNFDIPAQPLDSSQDAEFGLAVWVYNSTNTKWELTKVSNQSLQELIGVEPVLILDSPQRVYYQHKTDDAGGLGPDWGILPPIPAPAAMPIVSELGVMVDLTTIPGWNTAFKGVIVATMLKATTRGRFYDVALTIDGIDHARIACASDSASCCDNNEKWIKFNKATNKIQIDCRYMDVLAGTDGYLAAAVYIVGFFK